MELFTRVFICFFIYNKMKYLNLDDRIDGRKIRNEIASTCTRSLFIPKVTEGTNQHQTCRIQHLKINSQTIKRLNHTNPIYYFRREFSSNKIQWEWNKFSLATCASYLGSNETGQNISTTLIKIPNQM